MIKKLLHSAFKILAVLSAITTLILIYFRDELIMGTALIGSRWFLVFLFILFLWVAGKKRYHTIWKTTVVFGLLAVLTEFAFTIYHTQSLTGVSAKPSELSVLSYNLYFKNKSQSSCLKVIEKADADIVALQELTPQWKSYLDKHLYNKYPYRKCYAIKGAHGIGVYSRYPLSRQTFLNKKTNLPYAQLLEVEFNNKKIQLINCHLESPAIAVENPEKFLPLYTTNYGLRKEQMGNISQSVKKSEKQFDAHILLGDLNTTIYEPLYRDIQSDWVDLYSLSDFSFRFTFPNTHKLMPFLTLDYILLRGKAEKGQLNILEEGSSDHLPVFGTIKL